MTLLTLKADVVAAQAKVDLALLKLEGKIQKDTPELIEAIQNIANAIQAYAAKADGEIPLLTAALNSPLAATIISYLPEAEAVKIAVIGIINDFLPSIQSAANPTVMLHLVTGLKAEILKVENTAIVDINIAIRDIAVIATDIENL